MSQVSLPQPRKIWVNWLLGMAAVVVASGLFMVIAPALTRQGFSLLLYSSATHLDTISGDMVRYISVAHAVIGSVMVGWGMALFYVTKSLIAKGVREGWYVATLSLGAWYVPDSAYSILSGFWQNAVLNTAFLFAFAIPLWVLRPSGR